VRELPAAHTGSASLGVFAHRRAKLRDADNPSRANNDPDPLGRRRRAEGGRSGDPDQPAEDGNGREGCGVRSQAGRHRRPY
jgi:hypothetical protein